MFNFFNIAFLILIATTCQAQTPWQVNVGNIGEFPYYSIYENYDKGLMILSGTYPGTQYYLTKTDANGKMIYNRYIKYEKPKGNKYSNAQIGHIAPTKDGGLLLSGGLAINDTIENAFVAKLNACGDLDWSYILDDDIPLSYGNYINTISEIDNKNFFLVAQFSNYFVIMALNDSGIILNQSAISRGESSYTTSKTAHSDFMSAGNMYIKSTVNSTDTANYYSRSLLVRADQFGNLKWYNTYGLTEDSVSIANHTLEYDNKKSDIYLQGSHYNPISFGMNLTYLKKCDSMGNQIWHKNMGQQLMGKGQYFEEPRGIIKLKDGNLLLLESRDFDKFYRLSFARMIKVNPNGDVLDSVTLGDSANFYTLTSGVQTYDSNIVVAYSHYNTNHTNGYIHLRKFDYNMKQVNMTTTNFKYDSLCPHAVRTDDIDLSNSKTIPFILDTTHLYKSHKYYTTVNAIPTIEGRPQLKIWPNPFDTWLKVSMPPGNDITTAEMHDLTGKLIWSGRVYTNGMIETGQLPSGIYILSLYNRNGDKWNAKVVKE